MVVMATTRAPCSTLRLLAWYRACCSRLMRSWSRMASCSRWQRCPSAVARRWSYSRQRSELQWGGRCVNEQQGTSAHMTQ